MSRKKESGSRRKVDTTKHRKRRKREWGNREIKEERRIKMESEFAQRIREEPSLKEVIERDGMSVS